MYTGPGRIIYTPAADFARAHERRLDPASAPPDTRHSRHSLLTLAARNVNGHQSYMNGLFVTVVYVYYIAQCKYRQYVPLWYVRMLK
jgi:hypothetical protein